MTTSNESRPFNFNRALDAHTEEQGVTLWRLMFPRISEIQEKLDGPYTAVVEERSSLRLDDRYLGSWRGGGLHRGAMATAADALRTIRAILETNEVPMTALYPLLRAAVENSALAIYLLAPAARDIRLVRTYQVADDDAKWRCVFATTLGQEDAWVTRMRSKAEILNLIKSRPSLGSPKAVKLGAPKYGDVVALADEAIAADPSIPTNEGMPLLAWWQLMSGMGHGKQWSLIAALERSDAVVDFVDESAHVKMTSSTVMVALALQRSVEALETALRLYGQRSKAAWAQPEDASEPAPQSPAQLRAARRSVLNSHVCGNTAQGAQSSV
jgi:hypothetical protein